MVMLPFSAVVGADDAKLALLLASIDPAIGGVLLRGEKGSAKTTLARGLAALLPAGAPFVDLPVGATEDRVIGSLDITAALTGGEARLRPGLVAAAHGGVLYVDEVNLLPDHLVDVLLDVAATGVNRVERDGIASVHPARFILIGSMNPEEGELRPQFLDRFGLAVDVAAPTDVSERAAAVRRRLAVDGGGDLAAWAAPESELAAGMAAAIADGPSAVPDDVVEAVARLCLSVDAEGLRADLVICRAAAAHAPGEGRASASAADVRRVAPLALAHRTRRGPLDPRGGDQARMAEALDHAFPDGPQEPPAPASRAQDPAGDHPPDAAPDDLPSDAAPGGDQPAAPVPLPRDVPSVVRLEGRGSGTPGRRSPAETPRGRLVGDRSPGPGGPASVAVAATVRQALARRAAGDTEGPLVVAADLREAVREGRVGNLIVLAVDASGSMGAHRRMEAAKAAVLGLLVDAYQRRDRVALVTFRGDEASIVLRPTGSVEVARARLAELPTGGRTPLAAGIGAAMAVADGAADGHRPLLVFVTDGRATSEPSGDDPVSAARAAAARVRSRGLPAVVIDAEEGPARLGLAADLAEVMGARYVPVGELDGSGLQAAVRSSLPAPA